MYIKVQPVRDLSDNERQQLRKNLRWMLAENGEPWNEDLWCVTLENNALTLSVLVEQVDDVVFDEEGVPILA